MWKLRPGRLSSSLQLPLLEVSGVVQAQVVGAQVPLLHSCSILPHFEDGGNLRQDRSPYISWKRAFCLYPSQLTLYRSVNEKNSLVKQWDVRYLLQQPAVTNTVCIYQSLLKWPWGNGNTALRAGDMQGRPKGKLWNLIQLSFLLYVNQASIPSHSVAMRFKWEALQRALKW